MTTNPDKELLELAARAAGINLDETPTTEWRQGYKDWWNPLTDDGDAFRLAVMLNLFVDTQQESVLVGWVVDKDSLAIETLDEDKGTDPCAATRRAVVRAAAEIGKRMAPEGN